MLKNLVVRMSARYWIAAVFLHHEFLQWKIFACYSYLISCPFRASDPSEVCLCKNGEREKEIRIEFFHFNVVVEIKLLFAVPSLFFTEIRQAAEIEHKLKKKKKDLVKKKISRTFICKIDRWGETLFLHGNLKCVRIDVRNRTRVIVRNAMKSRKLNE